MNGTPWPRSPMTSLGGNEYQVFKVDMLQGRMPQWQNEARMRRASPIAIFMLEAARQAIDAAGNVDPARLGIVAAYGSGSLTASRRFFEGVLKNGQRFASPNLFPETVFNSPTSHLATVLGAAGPAYSVVGDNSAWVNAIQVAACWLANGVVEHALVIGAEELDPIILDAYASARWLSRNNHCGFTAAEGAGAILLRRATPSDSVRLEKVSEGWTFRNRRQARARAEECVADFGDVRRVCRTAQNTWFETIECELAQRHGWESPPPLPDCGYAFTATAAWQTVRAVEQVRRDGKRLAVPIWGLNEQCSALILAAK